MKVMLNSSFHLIPYIYIGKTLVMFTQELQGQKGDNFILRVFSAAYTPRKEDQSYVIGSTIIFKHLLGLGPYLIVPLLNIRKSVSELIRGRRGNCPKVNNHINHY